MLVLPPAQRFKSMVEDAIYEGAPDIVSIAVEGLEGKPAEGFVSLDKLMASHSMLSGADRSLGMDANSSREQNVARAGGELIMRTGIPGLRERIRNVASICPAAA